MQQVTRLDDDPALLNAMSEMLQQKASLILSIETLNLQPVQIDRLRSLLDEDEQIRSLRFWHQEDQTSYIAAHALKRAALANATSRPPQTFRFRYNTFGKPQPIMEQCEPQLQMSLSHTRGLAAVVLSIGRAVGVDVERLDRDTPLEVAKAHFALREQKLLEQTPKVDLPQAFFALWTLKEAYIKALGMGLSKPLDSFEFTLDPINLTDSSEVSKPVNWRFVHYNIGSCHSLAVAIEGSKCSPILYHSYK